MIAWAQIKKTFSKKDNFSSFCLLKPTDPVDILTTKLLHDIIFLIFFIHYASGINIQFCSLKPHHKLDCVLHQEFDERSIITVIIATALVIMRTLPLNIGKHG